MLNFESILLPQLIDLVYSEVLKKNYIIHSDVLARIEHVTVRLNSGITQHTAHGVMSELLDSYGIEAVNKRTHLFIQNQTESVESLETFYYLPKYRKSSYLLGLLSPAIEGFANKRQIASGASSSVSDDGLNKLIDKDGDGLLFIGSSEKVAILKKLLAQVDTPQKQVNIQAFVYEVSTAHNDSSALQLVMDMVKSTSISASIGAVRGAGQTFQISTPDLSLLFNLFNSDTRFEVLTSPSLFVRSGQKARFSVGTETPIISGLSYPGASTSPVQEIEYRPSGVIFEVQPVVHQDMIDINLVQQISTFVQTTTGVSSSPTLISRDIATDFSLKSGHMMVMAGLKERRDNHDSTYLPFTTWEVGRERSHTNTEIVLLLHCQVIEAPTQHNTMQASVSLDDFIAMLPDGQPFITPLSKDK